MQVSEYALESASRIDALKDKCKGDALEPHSATDAVIVPIPEATIKTLTDFIEYTESDLHILESTIALIQIHNSRIRHLVGTNKEDTGNAVIPKLDLENHIVDAAIIFAGTVEYLDYARKRKDQLPTNLTWESVQSALTNFSVLKNIGGDYQSIVERRRAVYSGPFSP